MNNINNPITEFVDQILNKSVSEVVKRDFVNIKPNVNIIKLEDKYIIQVAAPGLKKDDFSIELNNNKITISTDQNLDEVNQQKYSRREFNFTKFKRSFIVPNNIDKKSIKAKYKLGILEVFLNREAQIEKESISIDIN